jgi:tetratricopeptide (TPR) repeat protein
VAVRARRSDRRPLALAVTLAGVLGLGALLHWLPPPGGRGTPVEEAAVSEAPAAATGTAPASEKPPAADVQAHARDAEVAQRFQQAAMMLHARQHEYAAAALHRVLQLAPRMPEAHVNMGFALLGLDNPKAARDFFLTAIELNPGQANAYYGLAVALEVLEDLPGALGAMRTYIHLSDPEEPYLPRARAALWEWEAQAARQQEAGEGAGGSGTLAMPEAPP